MGNGTKWFAGALGGVLVAATAAAQAQDAKQIVRQVVNAELAANRDDHSHWRYLETEMDGSKYVVVETEHGAVKRHIDENGKPASAAVLAEDDEYIQKFIHDPSLQARQRQNGLKDDESFTELINLFPTAFDWKIVSDGGDTVTLAFHPDPNFHPPDMESRVMGRMSGTLSVDKSGYRIRTFQGALGEDVTIGFGLLARIKQGSSFRIEHRPVGSGVWLVTQTHVHISGHALFFKTIGQQEDEVKSDFTPVAPGTTLEQAVGMLKGK
jgi:hypothetical protein